MKAASSGNHDERFGGISRLYGKEHLNLFQQAHVAVVGIGGVGSWIVEALARSAIGELTLIDLDDVCVTNINRQILALDSTVGTLKVETMSQRVRDIAPQCQVNAIADFLTKDNVDQLITSTMHIVVDATDSIKAKTALIAYCKRKKIKIITIGGAGGQKDPTQIKVADLSRTQQDALSAKVRSELKRFYGFSKNPKRRYGVECIYSTEQPVYPKPDGSVCQAKSFQEGSTRLDCSSGFGATSIVTSTFATIAAYRVLEKLIGLNKK